jgi:glutaredoxin-dependent peroxiredoxin
VGVSADHAATLKAFADKNQLHHLVLSDFRRQMLPAFDAMVTDPQSPLFRYAKRAYFVIDKQGILRYAKVMDNPLDLLTPEDLLKAVKESGA